MSEVNNLHNTSPKTNQILYLQGLRGMAALTIFLNHFILLFFRQFSGEIPLTNIFILFRDHHCVLYITVLLLCVCLLF